MRLELHLLITGSQKGSKASSRGGKSGEACEIVSLILQHHRNDAGEAEEITVEELLPEDEARKVRWHADVVARAPPFECVESSSTFLIPNCFTVVCCSLSRRKTKRPRSSAASIAVHVCGAAR